MAWTLLLFILRRGSHCYVVCSCREEVQAAEEAVQVQSHKLREVLQEKTDLEARLQHSSHQLAALQAAADAAGHQKDAELQHLAAQLKVAARATLAADATGGRHAYHPCHVP